jgi:hypothetical protein
MEFSRKLISLVLLTAVILLVNSVLIIPLAVAQTNNEQSVALDWYQIIQVGGVAGLVSGGGAVLFEFFIDRSKGQSERKRKAIEDIVGLYSALIFYLDRMIENPEFSIGMEDSSKIMETKEDIDELIKAKFHLVDARVVSHWLYFRNHWHDLSWSTDDEKRLAQEVVDKVVDLRNLLVGKYNNKLRKDYKDRMSTDIEKIDPEKRPRLLVRLPG